MFCSTSHPISHLRFRLQCNIALFRLQCNIALFRLQCNIALFRLQCNIALFRLQYNISLSKQLSQNRSTIVYISKRFSY